MVRMKKKLPLGEVEIVAGRDFEGEGGTVMVTVSGEHDFTKFLIDKYGFSMQDDGSAHYEFHFNDEHQLFELLNNIVDLIQEKHDVMLKERYGKYADAIKFLLYKREFELEV